MRKYFCDVCGAALSEEQAGAVHDSGLAALAAACRPPLVDICKSCAEKGRNIDIRSVILPIWKQAPPAADKQSPDASAAHRNTKKRKEQRTISADQNSKPGPGNHWRKKKLIFKQLMKYRKLKGLGSLQPLAEKSGVPLDVLRQMLDSQPVDIETWRKAGAALDDMGVVLTEEEAAGC